jgi:hypothetical protein
MLGKTLNSEGERPEKKRARPERRAQQRNEKILVRKWEQRFQFPGIGL